MARSRKTPPLFEVMRETDRRVEMPRPIHTGGILPRRSTAEDQSGKLRLAEAGSNGVAGEHAETRAGPSKSLVVPLPVALSAVGILIAVVAAVSILAFKAGAKRERDQLLPKDSGPPPVVTPDVSLTNRPVIPQPERKTVEPTPPPEPPAAKAGAPPVFGDDPREVGKNYLVVERLLFDDAMEAAQFLTDNGVASVVVPPEGLKTEDLLKQPRALWLVVVREGFTRDEFRADGARATAIKNAVIHLGRRWKQDHKGKSDFASCLWDKYGN